MQKKRWTPYLVHIIIKKKTNSEGIRDLNIRAKTTKLFGKKHDVYLCDLRLVIVLAMTSKVQRTTTGHHQNKQYFKRHELQNSIIHNSQKAEITQISIKR